MRRIVKNAAPRPRTRSLPFNCPIARSLNGSSERPASGSNPVQFGFGHKRKNGKCAMARIDFASLPRKHPWAQCGEPIAAPEWVEAEASRTFYLWRCRACDYRFEAVAYFDDSATDNEALAA